jgi:hypothetical protein
MNLAITLLTIAVACPGTVQPTDGTRHFRLDVPPRVESEQTHLLLREVVVPRNQPVLLRVYAIAPDGSKIYLGSTAVPAVSEDSAGVTSIGVLRINVTTGLRVWRSAAKGTRSVDIEIDGSNGVGIPVQRSRWSVRALELIHPDFGLRH